MENLFKVNENIYRLITPYKDIWTTVYLIRTEEGYMLFDTASSDSDTEEYILPMLAEAGVDPMEIKCVFISHKHRDHAGGLARLMKAIPDAVIVSRHEKMPEEYAEYKVVCPEDGDMLLGVLQVVTIPGHTLDSSAVLDTRTGTMITGDCLQLFGIFGMGDWACNISFIPEHFCALDKVREMDVAEIYTAHDYYPIGYRFVGKEQIYSALDNCKKPLLRIKKLIEDNPELDNAAIREAFGASEKLPTVSVGVVAAVRKAASEGKI